MTARCDTTAFGMSAFSNASLLAGKQRGNFLVSYHLTPGDVLLMSLCTPALASALLPLISLSPVHFATTCITMPADGHWQPPWTTKLPSSVTETLTSAAPVAVISTAKGFVHPDM